MRAVLRSVLLALLVSLLAGFAFGTCLRRRAERPTVYIGLERLSEPGTFVCEASGEGLELSEA